MNEEDLEAALEAEIAAEEPGDIWAQAAGARLGATSMIWARSGG